MAEREGEDGEVDGEIAETFDEGGGHLLENTEVGLRVLAGEGGGVAGHEVGSDGRDDADGDAAAEVRVSVGDAGAGGLSLLEDGAGVREEGAAGLSEADAAAQAVEEFYAEVAFELEDLLGERGLGDGAALGGAAEAAGIGDGACVFELVELHR